MKPSVSPVLIESLARTYYEQNQDAIRDWIMYWPFSVVSYFTTEFIRNIVVSLMDFTENLFVRVIVYSMPR